MDDPLPVRPTRALAAPQGGSGTAPPNPLRTLPAELRQPASRFIAFYSESLKGSAALVARLLWWIETEGLRPVEAVRALAKLMEPEKAAGLDYSGKALAALAAEVDRILKARREKEAMLARRAAAASDKTASATVEILKAAIGRME